MDLRTPLRMPRHVSMGSVPKHCYNPRQNLYSSMFSRSVIPPFRHTVDQAAPQFLAINQLSMCNCLRKRRANSW
jgi:hypothetical protein